MRLSDQERRDRAQQLQRTMLLLVHASNCKDANCSSSHCGKVKNLFHHAATCQKKIAGGCPLCRYVACQGCCWLLGALPVLCTALWCVILIIAWAAGATTLFITAVSFQKFVQFTELQS